MSKGNLSEVFHTDPEIMGGTPVFTGTRVPVQNLVDYLEGGESNDEFLAGFPTVRREQVIGFIDAARERLASTAKTTTVCTSRRAIPATAALSTAPPVMAAPPTSATAIAARR